MRTADHETIYSLSLPEVGDSTWAIPGNVRKGLPTLRDNAASRDIWQVLALLASGLLVFEWIRWGQAVKRTSSAATPRLKKVA